MIVVVTDIFITFLILMEMPLEAVCNCIVFSEFCSVENSFMK